MKKTFLNMGCGPSRATKEEIARDRRIGKELRRDFSKDAQIVKLLLLGAGESGKSTIVKQVRQKWATEMSPKYARTFLLSHLPWH